MTTITDNGEFGIRVAGGKVQIIDVVEDEVVRALDPTDALALADSLAEHREQIAALAARKTWAQRVANVVGTVTQFADVPHSFTITQGGGAEVKLYKVEHVEAIAATLNEPVSASYDASWNTYDGLAGRVTFTVVGDGVTYSATELDVDLATVLTEVPEPVSA